MKGTIVLKCTYIHARYQEKAPRTMADIANSIARSKVDAARVPSASLDMFEGCGKER